MPQFDTFSFFSQLFWVFLAFTTLYLLLSFYLLPALAAILKIRKRKLAAQTMSTSNAVATDNASTTTESTNSLVSSLSAKISSFETNVSQSANLSNSLNMLTMQIEASNRFNLSVLSQAQLTTLFYN
jgi:F-type H+-transporting ATPase subunit b